MYLEKETMPHLAGVSCQELATVAAVKNWVEISVWNGSQSLIPYGTKKE